MNYDLGSAEHMTLFWIQRRRMKLKTNFCNLSIPAGCKTNWFTHFNSKRHAGNLRYTGVSLQLYFRVVFASLSRLDKTDSSFPSLYNYMPRTACHAPLYTRSDNTTLWMQLASLATVACMFQADGRMERAPLVFDKAVSGLVVTSITWQGWRGNGAYIARASRVSEENRSTRTRTAHLLGVVRFAVCDTVNRGSLYDEQAECEHVWTTTLIPLVESASFGHHQITLKTKN